MSAASGADAPESLIRVRVSAADAHYGGGLVDAGRVVALFGDAVTEVLIRHDGDEGLLRAYAELEFTAPVHPGDYLEIRARLEDVGRSSRRVRCTAHKIIALDSPDGSAASVLPEPQLVARALAIAVVPEASQRRRAAPA